MAQRPIDCAVMFVDMRGFTRASEHLGPDGAVALLEGYFELLVGVVYLRSGERCEGLYDGSLHCLRCGLRGGGRGCRRGRRGAGGRAPD